MQSCALYANVAYFHLIARGRKRRNFIPSLTVVGHVIADLEGMEQGLFDHFSGVFGTAESGCTSINFAALGIHPLPLAELEANINTDEVWNAIKELPPNRAPGSDGFTCVFHKTAWLIIQDSVMAAIQSSMHGDCRGQAEQRADCVVAQEGGSIFSGGLSTDNNDSQLRQTDLQDPCAEAGTQTQRARRQKPEHLHLGKDHTRQL